MTLSQDFLGLGKGKKKYEALRGDERCRPSGIPYGMLLLGDVRGQMGCPRCPAQPPKRRVRL